MKAVLISGTLLATLLSGCTFGRQSLPDHFDVRANGIYRWSPMPFAEGGVYYDFIGIGWLVHDERGDELCLSLQDKDLAIAGHLGGDGWTLTARAREMIAKHGWSLGGFKSGLLAGTAGKADPRSSEPRSPRKRFTPGMPYLNLPGETDYLYEWHMVTEPLRTLDDTWNTAVFLLSSWDHAYVRIAGYDSSHYEWVGSSIIPAPQGWYVVNFTIRDRRTGGLLIGSYTYEWRKTGQVNLEVTPSTKPNCTGERDPG